MRCSSARRELAFVLAVASAGLAVVLVVVFAPWYRSDQAPVADVIRLKPHVVQLVGREDCGAALTP